MSDVVQSLHAGLKRVVDEQHQAMREVVEGLSADALNWRPGPDTNSITVLITHALGAEEFLMSTAVGETVPRDREAEFRAAASDAATLRQLIETADARATALIDRLTAEDLAATRQPANDRLNRVFPGTWWLLHALTHNGEHIGQAFLTRQLYEQQH